MPEQNGDVGKGVGLAFLLHLLQIPMILVYATVFSRVDDYATITPLPFIGLSQIVYMVPAILIARRKGKDDLMKGLIIGASITFLLNATCLSLIFIVNRS